MDYQNYTKAKVFTNMILNILAKGGDSVPPEAKLHTKDEDSVANAGETSYEG